MVRYQHWVYLSKDRNMKIYIWEEPYGSIKQKIQILKESETCDVMENDVKCLRDQI